MDRVLQPNRFSIQYRGAARGRDYEAWREGVCRGFCRLDVGPARDDCIDCGNDFASLHSLALATPNGSSARFARTRDLMQDGCDDFVLISASRGRIRVTQKSRAIELSKGQMCLTEMNVEGAAELTPEGSFITTRIPRRALLQIAPRAETQLARPLANEAGLRSLIDRYFALCNDVAAELDAPGQQAAAQHLVDLIGLLLGGGAGQEDVLRRRGYSAARLEVMKAQVIDSLHRGGLTIDRIAQGCGISARQAQRLFAHSGQTFSEFVLDQRLSLARRLLTAASNRHRRISDIAYQSGFSDLSYFNRSFKRRFGATPSDVQAGAGVGAP
ncbi:AraC family transcriptional regulator [Bradyrhizobium sp.]|uniref:AraC family transcriptional regulator n=1 Tax=Bradyrhizobium sp. TaxID=376 RepID=UPI002D454E99|nr:AraC family transcriptional regulator [Bradyrhizobium sp.]HZR75204.1 AraC family transcriptional regulator [Bradyrhizobium sp.]